LSMRLKLRPRSATSSWPCTATGTSRLVAVTCATAALSWRSGSMDDFAIDQPAAAAAPIASAPKKASEYSRLVMTLRSSGRARISA